MGVFKKIGGAFGGRGSGGGFLSRAWLSSMFAAASQTPATPRAAMPFETREQNRRTASAGAVQSLYPGVDDEADMLGRTKRKGAARTLLG